MIDMIWKKNMGNKNKKKFSQRHENYQDIENKIKIINNQIL